MPKESRHWFREAMKERRRRAESLDARGSTPNEREPSQMREEASPHGTD